MDTIELFCGGGGGIVAHYHLLKHTPIAAAEIASYPREVLQARMRDGSLPRLELYTDVRTVGGKRYHNIGCVSGGFPCQDLSAAAGERAIGIDGVRSGMVWEMLRIISEARPRYVFAENSPRLRAKGLNRILQHLAGLGYTDAAWGVISGADVRAPHLRERMWLIARRTRHPMTIQLPVQMPRDGMLRRGELSTHRPWVAKGETAMLLPTLIAKDAAAAGNRPDPTLWSLSDMLGITAKAARHGIKTLPTLAATDWKSPYGLEGLRKQLAKRSKPLRDVLPLIEGGRKISPTWAEWYMGWPPGWTDLDRLSRSALRRWEQTTLSGRWWTDNTERGFLPRTLPSGEGVPQIGARIKALGNGQIPLCAATAFSILQQALES